MSRLHEFLAPLLIWRMLPAWIFGAFWMASFIGFANDWGDWGRRNWAIYAIAWQVITIFTASLLDPSRGGS